MKSRMVSSAPSWNYVITLIVCTQCKSNIHNQGIIWEDQVRRGIPLWLSGPIFFKWQGLPFMTLLTRISGSF